MSEEVMQNEINHTNSNVNTLFPVFLKLEQMKVLLIGAGNVGLEKLTAIVNNAPAAKVTVVAKEITPAFAELAKNFDSTVTVIQAPYDASFMDAADIVISAINDHGLSAVIRNDAKQRGKLINVADKPGLCDFYLGSIVTKGSLKLAISTNGKSPTVAKRLKEVFNELLPGELEEVLDNLQQIREELKGDFSHKVNELNKITKTLVEKTAPKDAEEYWFL
ncbi:precorrin-2 dehydrogenase/sirohydrochlorin ferrochelatase family protein [Foetidibacter luteolus]|uniref:precorrin-2 dehydrogenase/sirohydrochlorin ferrochelatase family protein n=1 Tax=Foetidibacter luteolus TaxID=2608880 RepID=UPI001F40BD49|nr:bifunctional precorrin-2 dehydrogenase/sirohydrochlorin ferrochelatase [Foetidibacter luteolus]